MNKRSQIKTLLVLLDHVIPKSTDWVFLILFKQEPFMRLGGQLIQKVLVANAV